MGDQRYRAPLTLAHKLLRGDGAERYLPFARSKLTQMYNDSQAGEVLSRTWFADDAVIRVELFDSAGSIYIEAGLQYLCIGVVDDSRTYKLFGGLSLRLAFRDLGTIYQPSSPTAPAASGTDVQPTTKRRGLSVDLSARSLGGPYAADFHMIQPSGAHRVMVTLPYALTVLSRVVLLNAGMQWIGPHGTEERLLAFAGANFTVTTGNYRRTQFMMSKDGGRTWGTPGFIGAADEAYHQVTGQPAYLGNGSLAFMSYLYTDAFAPTSDPVLMRSDDYGDTWAPVSVPGLTSWTDGSPNYSVVNDQRQLYTSDGLLLALGAGRVAFLGQRTLATNAGGAYLHFSTDNAATFDTGVSIGDVLYSAEPLGAGWLMATVLNANYAQYNLLLISPTGTITSRTLPFASSGGNPPTVSLMKAVSRDSGGSLLPDTAVLAGVYYDTDGFYVRVSSDGGQTWAKQARVATTTYTATPAGPANFIHLAPLSEGGSIGLPKLFANDGSTVQ